MKKTPEEIKKFLEGYSIAKEKMENVKELYLRVYSTATSCGGQGQFGGYNGGLAGRDRVGNSVVALEEVEEKIKLRARKLAIRKKNIEYCIDKVPYSRVRDVLRMTYIDGEDRSYIAGQLGVSRATVTADRKKGIDWIAANINFKGA